MRRRNPHHGWPHVCHRSSTDSGCVFETYFATLDQSLTDHPRPFARPVAAIPIQSLDDHPRRVRLVGSAPADLQHPQQVPPARHHLFSAAARPLRYGTYGLVCRPSYRPEPFQHPSEALGMVSIYGSQFYEKLVPLPIWRIGRRSQWSLLIVNGAHKRSWLPG